MSQRSISLLVAALVVSGCGGRSADDGAARSSGGALCSLDETTVLASEAPVHRLSLNTEAGPALAWAAEYTGAADQGMASFASLAQRPDDGAWHSSPLGQGIVRAELGGPDHLLLESVPIGAQGASSFSLRTPLAAFGQDLSAKLGLGEAVRSLATRRALSVRGDESVLLFIDAAQMPRWSLSRAGKLVSSNALDGDPVDLEVDANGNAHILTRSAYYTDGDKDVTLPLGTEKLLAVSANTAGAPYVVMSKSVNKRTEHSIAYRDPAGNWSKSALPPPVDRGTPCAKFAKDGDSCFVDTVRYAQPALVRLGNEMLALSFKHVRRGTQTCVAKPTSNCHWQLDGTDEVVLEVTVVDAELLRLSPVTKPWASSEDPTTLVASTGADGRVHAAWISNTNGLRHAALDCSVPN